MPSNICDWPLQRFAWWCCSLAKVLLCSHPAALPDWPHAQTDQKWSEDDLWPKIDDWFCSCFIRFADVQYVCEKRSRAVIWRSCWPRKHWIDYSSSRLCRRDLGMPHEGIWATLTLFYHYSNPNKLQIIDGWIFTNWNWISFINNKNINQWNLV